MMRMTINKMKNDSYKKWTFLRDVAFSRSNYKTQQKIRNIEIKEYEKYLFLKKLSEVIEQGNQPNG